MNLQTRIQDLLQRIASYEVYEVVIELGIIWLLAFAVVRFVQGTRAAAALRGVAFLLVMLVLAGLALRVLGGAQGFQRLYFLANSLFAIIAIALIVIFQPELRRAALRLGEAGLFRSTPSDIVKTVSSVVDACVYLSKTRIGALIVLERQVGLEGLTEGGTRLDAAISTRLLQTIFYPGTALHDLAVVIRGKIVRAAGVQLPLAEPAEMPDPTLGSRHRAAVGLTKECDAIAVVVSEETGSIRVAERGRLSAPMEPDELRKLLMARLEQASPERGATAVEKDAIEARERREPATAAEKAEAEALAATEKPARSKESA